MTGGTAKYSRNRIQKPLRLMTMSRDPVIRIRTGTQAGYHKPFDLPVPRNATFKKPLPEPGRPGQLSFGDLVSDDQLVQCRGDLGQPFSTLCIFRQCNDDVLAPVSLDDCAVRMPLPPGTGLAVYL